MLPSKLLKRGLMVSSFLLLLLNTFSQTADEYYNKALDAFKASDYSNCVYYAKKAIELNRYDYEAHGLLGQAYYKLKDYQNAITSLSESLGGGGLSSTFQSYYYYLRASAKSELGDYDGAISDYGSCISKYIADYSGSAYWERGVLYHNKKNNVTAAKNDYQSAVNYFSGNKKNLAILYSNISSCEYNLSNYQKSLEAANTSIDNDKDYYKGYMWQGYAYKGLTKYDDAKKSFSRSLNLIKDANNEDLGYIYRNLGLCYYELWQYDEAITHFKLAIEKKANYGDAYWDLANAYYQNMNYDDAVRYYTTAITYYLDKPQSMGTLHRWRGKSYFGARQYQKAISDYHKALEYYTDSEKDANVYADVAWSELYTGNITSALASISKAIELKPDDSYFPGDKATMLACRKSYKEAITLLDKQIEKRPDNSSLYFKRAFFKWKMNDKAAAAEDFTMFKEKTYYDTTLSMAIYYTFLGKKTEGLAIMKAVLRSSSDVMKKWDYHDLAVLHALSGNVTEAIKALELAVKAGYKSFEWLQLDYELQTLHDKPEFAAFLKKHKIARIVKK